MTPERYKRLTDWLEGHPALREGIILLNRWLPLVPFVCYPVLLVLLNLRWFTMLTIGRGGGALDFMQVIARAILVPGLAFWLGTILRARLNFPRPYQLLIRGHLRAALLIVKGNGTGHLLGNDAGRIGSAHTGRQNQHMIAHAHTAVRALITVKSHRSTLLTLLLPDFPGGLPRCEHGRVHRL